MEGGERDVEGLGWRKLGWRGKGRWGIGMEGDRNVGTGMGGQG